MEVIEVQLVYALPGQAYCHTLQLPADTTIAQAIEMFDLFSKYPELLQIDYRVGIFGRLATLETILHNKDRIEIYRPLKLSPLEARRLIAEKNRRAS